MPEPDNNNIGANDWKYILGAGLLLTAFGGPLYLHYLCQWDLEVRWAVEEDYPRIYGLLANHLDLQSHIPAHAKNVDRAPAGVFLCLLLI